MNQCVRCNRAYSGNSEFCDECHDLLRTQLQPDGVMNDDDIARCATAPLATASVMIERMVLQGEVATHAADPITPLPFLDETQADKVEQALTNLNDAARLIASVEPGERRRPRVSRLSPFRDISAEIQRASTPLPSFTKDAATTPMVEVDVEEPEAQRWSAWLDDIDIDETEDEDDQMGNTDPLVSRSFADLNKAHEGEEETLRARFERVITMPLPVHLPSPNTRLRLAFFSLATLAIVALIVDTVLASFTLVHTQQAAKNRMTSNAPILTLSPTSVTYGTTVTLTLQHFAPNVKVYLTHDVAEPLHIDPNGQPIVTTGADGSMIARVTIDESWEPGSHTIVAEDVVSHYTANTTLLVAEGPTRPSRLILSNTQIDLGSNVVGASTIQRFVLSNAGGGSIAWQASSSDSSWLLVSPNQGVFSDAQTIIIGGGREGKAPGDYEGTITFTTNVGAPQKLHVSMSVRPLPADAGGVLSVSPVVLSFVAIDGGADPDMQTLQISNPGKKPLNWSLSGNTSTTSQDSFLKVLNNNVNWLTTDQRTGTVKPGDVQKINVIVHSSSLLPGTYMNTLVFTADQGTINSPQNVSISLTVQPRCSTILSTGVMSFTGVQGKNNLSPQTVTLTPTASCTNTINWTAYTQASWLTLSATSGQISSSNVGSTISATVNIGSLSPGVYNSSICIVTGQSTQTVLVTLTVQAPPPPSAPIISLSQLNLNFSYVQGQPNPPPQAITITNIGGSTLTWHTNINQLLQLNLVTLPSGGPISAGQSTTMQVRVLPAQLNPGKYSWLITLSGTDANGKAAGGSPQNITVNLQVTAPCSLVQPSATSLTFNALQGSADPTTQSIVISASGSCAWPMNWNARLQTAAPWLAISPASGTFTTGGQSATMIVAPSISGLSAGKYTAEVDVTVQDSSGTQPQGSPQAFTVTLNVQQPCQLQLSPTGLSFNLAQGQSSAVQNVTISETGTCATPVSWTASVDSGSSSWLVLSATSGSDAGTGSTLGISVSAANQTPGVYKGTITLTATGSGGAVVQGSPVTLPVTLTVSGFSVSGSVNACADSSCTAPGVLSGATVSLVDSSGKTVATATTDASGSFLFKNVPLGSYTISASGSDSSNIQYTGTASVTVSGNVSTVVINAIAMAATPTTP